MAPGIGIGLGVPFQKNAFSFQAYWATLISATVENAAPTHVVLTFPSEGTSVATDITCTVNGVARTVSSASWTGAVWTVVLASAVEYGDLVVMTFKLTNTVAVTNNVLTCTAIITSNGNGVSTMSLNVSENITVTLGANAKFYSDAAGTADESATWAVSTGALRIIYIKCTSGTAIMTFSDGSKLRELGQFSVEWGFSAAENGPLLSIKIEKLPITDVLLSSGATITGLMPITVTVIYIQGYGDIYTQLSIPGSSNITIFALINYREAKMSSADMITLLTQLTNRTGTLPDTVTINDYADFEAPPAEVVTAVDLLKTTKSITTVTLGA